MPPSPWDTSSPLPGGLLSIDSLAYPEISSTVGFLQQVLRGLPQTFSGYMAPWQSCLLKPSTAQIFFGYFGLIRASMPSPVITNSFFKNFSMSRTSDAGSDNSSLYLPLRMFATSLRGLPNAAGHPLSATRPDSARSDANCSPQQADAGCRPERQ